MIRDVWEKCIQLFRSIENFKHEKMRQLNNEDLFKGSLKLQFHDEVFKNFEKNWETKEIGDLTILYLNELSQTNVIKQYFQDAKPFIVDSLESVRDDLFVEKANARTLYVEIMEIIDNFSTTSFFSFEELCHKKHLFIYPKKYPHAYHDDIELLDPFITEDIVKADKQSVLPSFGIDRPIFVQEYLKDIIDILKDFFSEEDQKSLHSMLQNKVDSAKPLVFLDAGNRLADAFKQLYEANIIRGCMKKDLESWICRNFNYVHRNQIKPFVPKYISEIISTKKDKCTRPFLNVRFDKNQNKNILIRL